MPDTVPKFLKLSGRDALYYSAGLNVGASQAFTDCAAYLEDAQAFLRTQVELLPDGHPARQTMANVLSSGAMQLRTRAKAHHDRGESEIRRLHVWQQLEGFTTITRGKVIAAMAVALVIAVVMLIR